MPPVFGRLMSLSAGFWRHARRRCSERRHPGKFALVEIERRDPAVGRLQDGQPFDRQIGAPSARESQVRLRIVDDGYDPGTGLRGNVEITRFGVEAAALPERAAGSAGVVPGAFGAVRLDFGGRREHRSQPILFGDPYGLSPQLRREVDQIVLDIALVVVGGRLGRDAAASATRARRARRLRAPGAPRTATPAARSRGRAHRHSPASSTARAL